MMGIFQDKLVTWHNKIMKKMSNIINAWNHRNDKNLAYKQGFKYYDVYPNVDRLKENLHFGWSEDSIPELDNAPYGYYIMVHGNPWTRFLELYAVLKDEDGYATNWFNPLDPGMNPEIVEAAIAFTVKSVGIDKFLGLNKEFSYIERRRSKIEAENAFYLEWEKPTIENIRKWARTEHPDDPEAQKKYIETAIVMMNHY